MAVFRPPNGEPSPSLNPLSLVLTLKPKMVGGNGEFSIVKPKLRAWCYTGRSALDQWRWLSEIMNGGEDDGTNPSLDDETSLRIWLWILHYFNSRLSMILLWSSVGSSDQCKESWEWGGRGLKRGGEEKDQRGREIREGNEKQTIIPNLLCILLHPSIYTLLWLY